MADNILEDLKCPVCLEICEDPIETNCCHKLLCKSCVEQLDKCVYCRIKCYFSPSFIGQRMINSLPYECEYCQIIISRGDKKDHSLKCEKIPTNCPVCNIKVEKMKILNHLLETHSDEMFKNLDSIFNSFQANNVIKTGISIEAQKNGKGNDARLGETGKYYCGAQLDGFCNCCDGNCGPTSGCNCSFCMKLDIKSRNLPRGWLVNAAGFNARKYNQNGNYYCGRRVMTGVRDCDGYCGPTNGPNCDDCRRLDRMSQNRYKQFVD